jgi:hypothetical protein
MQYYTKQQLQGGLSYNPPCRLGNWAEDGNQDEAKLKDYLKSKAEGGLKLDVLRMRMERAMAPVRWNASHPTAPCGLRFSGMGDGVCVSWLTCSTPQPGSLSSATKHGSRIVRAQPAAAFQPPSTPGWTKP